jgi:hypothetical protein
MITIVVPNLNTKNSWKRTLHGLKRNAKYIHSVIIVDGKSIDDSGKLLHQNLLALNIDSKIFFQDPNGIIAAIRFGVSKAQSSHLVVNLSGDTIVKLPKLPLKENFLYYGICDVRNVKNDFLYQFKESNLNAIKYRMPKINMNSIIWPTAHFKNFKSLNINYKVASDFALLLEAYNRNIKFKFNKNIQSYFYADGLSSNKKMLSYGFGEVFFISLIYGSFYLSLSYNCIRLFCFKVNVFSFYEGFIDSFRKNI